MGVPPKVPTMFVSSTERIIGLHYALMGVPPKVQPMFVLTNIEVKTSPKESLGYTVLTDVCLALCLKKKRSDLFRQKSSFVSPKNLTPYWVPKDVKSSSIREECFARVNKFGLHEFQCKDAKTYRHNYSTQTLSSNSWHVA